MNPYSMYTVATQHQADLLAEADHQRLVREARKRSAKEPQSPARRLVAAAAAAALALSMAGAAFAAQSGDAPASNGGEACVEVGGGKLAC